MDSLQEKAQRHFEQTTQEIIDRARIIFSPLTKSHREGESYHPKTKGLYAVIWANASLVALNFFGSTSLNFFHSLFDTLKWKSKSIFSSLFHSAILFYGNSLTVSTIIFWYDSFCLNSLFGLSLLHLCSTFSYASLVLIPLICFNTIVTLVFPASFLLSFVKTTVTLTVTFTMFYIVLSNINIYIMDRLLDPDSLSLNMKKKKSIMFSFIMLSQLFFVVLFLTQF